MTGQEASRPATDTDALPTSCRDGGGGTWFGGRARTLRVETHLDDRGWLAAVDFDVVGFDVTRAFVVGAAEGVSRGGHGHRRGRQLLTLVSGRVRVDLRWRAHTASVLLSGDRRCLLVEPGVWAAQTYLDPHSSLVVFCDTPYDPGDYVHDGGDAGW